MFFGLGQTSTTSIVDTLSAKIQAEVGKFLALKAQIIRIRDSSKTPAIQQLASTLYEQQLTAEAAVTDALAAVDAMKSSGVSFASLGTITSGIAKMEYQISQVKGLQSDYDKEVGTSGMGSLMDYITPTNLIIGGLVAFIFLRRRRR